MVIRRKRSIDIKRTLAAGNALILAGLVYVSMVHPAGFVMSLADYSYASTILRVIAFAGMLSILISRPPRSMFFRYALGAASSVILIGSFIAMTGYTIGVIDAIIYLQVSIILAIEALEFQPVQSTARRIRIQS